MISYTYTFKFNTTGVDAVSKCSVCGSRIKKRFSFEYRSDLGPSKEDWDFVNAKKQKWEAEEHVCTKCRRAACKQAANDITGDISNSVNVLEQVYSDYLNYCKEKYEYSQKFVTELKEKLKGTICRHGNTEYVITNVYFSLNGGDGLWIDAYAINKQQPWLDTDKWAHFTFEKYGNTFPIKDVIFTDETLQSRKDLLKNV